MLERREEAIVIELDLNGPHTRECLQMFPESSLVGVLIKLFGGDEFSYVNFLTGIVYKLLRGGDGLLREGYVSAKKYGEILLERTRDGVDWEQVLASVNVGKKRQRTLEDRPLHLIQGLAEDYLKLPFSELFDSIRVWETRHSLKRMLRTYEQLSASLSQSDRSIYSFTEIYDALKMVFFNVVFPYIHAYTSFLVFVTTFAEDVVKEFMGATSLDKIHRDLIHAFLMVRLPPVNIFEVTDVILEKLNSEYEQVSKMTIQVPNLKHGNITGTPSVQWCVTFYFTMWLNSKLGSVDCMNLPLSSETLIGLDYKSFAIAANFADSLTRLISLVREHAFKNPAAFKTEMSQYNWLLQRLNAMPKGLSSQEIEERITQDLLRENQTFGTQGPIFAHSSSCETLSLNNTEAWRIWGSRLKLFDTGEENLVIHKLENLIQALKEYERKKGIDVLSNRSSDWLLDTVMKYIFSKRPVLLHECRSMLDRYLMAKPWQNLMEIKRLYGWLKAKL